MTDRWHRTSSLAGLPGMPNTVRPIRLHGVRRGWVRREVPLGRRKVLEWLESSLPAETRSALSGHGAPQVHSPPAAVQAEDTAQNERSGCDVSSAVFSGESAQAARADARLEITAAFRRSRRGPFISDLKAWAARYSADPAASGVSEETRRLYPSVAWNTLQRWVYAHSGGGVTALLPDSAGRTSVIDADPGLAALIGGLLAGNPHHITARNIRRAVEAECGMTLHISQIRRWARRWRRVNSHLVSAVADPDGHRSRLMPAFGAAAAEVEELNGVWEIDSSPADVICSDGKRHAIICAVDVWSRRARVAVAPESCSAAIAALIRRCLLDWGVPRMIVSDGGADYTSRHIRRVYDDLGIAHRILPPYSPDKKPFIERFIGTVSRDLFTQLPGFCGHSVADRQRLRDRRSFAARRGETDTAAFSCALSAGDLQRHIDGWCADIYGREPHSGLGGLSPFGRAAGWTGGIRTVGERGLDILLAPAAGDGTRTVGKKGIRVDGADYIAPELGRHMGERVHVRRDPASPDRIYVFTLRDAPGVRGGEFICIAEDPGRTGADRRRIAVAAKAAWRARNRDERRLARDMRTAGSPAAPIGTVLDLAAAAASKVTALPHRGGEHTSDGLEAARRAARASEQASRRDRGDREADGDDLLMKFYEGSY